MGIAPSAEIHASSVIEKGAEIGPGVKIGPFCHVGAGVVLGAGVELRSHVVIDGDTHLGEGCRVFPFASLGLAPQDLKYKGEHTRLRIGPRNTIREYVTMNPGTAGGGGLTRIGEGGLYMASCHVAHDCLVGDRVIMANSSALGGHCVVEDEAIIGGLSGVHQFVRIGRGAMIGSLSRVNHDVLPHTLVVGEDARLSGLNLVGLKRRGVSRAEIAELQDALRSLTGGGGTLQARAEALGEARREGGEEGSTQLHELLAFILAETDRGFLLQG